MNRIVFIFFLTGFSLFGAISSRDKMTFHSKSEMEDSVIFKTYTLVSNYPDKHKSSKITDQVKLVYLHPTNFHNQVVLEKLQDTMADIFSGNEISYTAEDNTPAKARINFSNSKRGVSPKKILNEVIEQRREMIRNNLEEGVTGHFEYAASLKPLYNKNNILSLIKQEYEYNAGSAHGHPISSFYVIDLTTGELINYNDIFNPSSFEELSEILTEKVKREIGISGNSKLSNNGYFVDVIPPADNFYINETGISFHYNVYEIAPYIYGEKNIELKYSDLPEGLLKKSTVFYELFCGNKIK